MSTVVPLKLTYKGFLVALLILWAFPGSAQAVQYFIGPQICAGQNVGQYANISMDNSPCTGTTTLAYNYLYFATSTAGIPAMGSVTSQIRYGTLASSTLITNIGSANNPFWNYNEKKFIGESVGNSDIYCTVTNPSSNSCHFWRIGN